MVNKKLIITLTAMILLLAFYSTAFAQDDSIEEVADNDYNYYSFICFQETLNDVALDKLSNLKNGYAWSIALYSIPTYAVGSIMTFYSIQSLITLEMSIPIHELLFITADIFYLCSTTASTTGYLYNLRLYNHIINNAKSGKMVDWDMLNYIYNSIKKLDIYNGILNLTIGRGVLTTSIILLSTYNLVNQLHGMAGLIISAPFLIMGGIELAIGLNLKPPKPEDFIQKDEDKLLLSFAYYPILEWVMLCR